MSSTSSSPRANSPRTVRGNPQNQSTMNIQLRQGGGGSASNPVLQVQHGEPSETAAPTPTIINIVTASDSQKTSSNEAVPQSDPQANRETKLPPKTSFSFALSSDSEVLSPRDELEESKKKEIQSSSTDVEGLPDPDTLQVVPQQPGDPSALMQFYQNQRTGPTERSGFFNERSNFYPAISPFQEEPSLRSRSVPEGGTDQGGFVQVTEGERSRSYPAIPAVGESDVPQSVLPPLPPTSGQRRVPMSPFQQPGDTPTHSITAGKRPARSRSAVSGKQTVGQASGGMPSMPPSPFAQQAAAGASSSQPRRRKQSSRAPQILEQLRALQDMSHQDKQAALQAIFGTSPEDIIRRTMLADASDVVRPSATRDEKLLEEGLGSIENQDPDINVSSSYTDSDSSDSLKTLQEGLSQDAARMTEKENLPGRRGHTVYREHSGTVTAQGNTLYREHSAFYSRREPMQSDSYNRPRGSRETARHAMEMPQIQRNPGKASGSGRAKAQRPPYSGLDRMLYSSERTMVRDKNLLGVLGGPSLSPPALEREAPVLGNDQPAFDRASAGPSSAPKSQSRSFITRARRAVRSGQASGSGVKRGEDSSFVPLEKKDTAQGLEMLDSMIPADDKGDDNRNSWLSRSFAHVGNSFMSSRKLFGKAGKKFIRSFSSSGRQKSKGKQNQGTVPQPVLDRPASVPHLSPGKEFKTRPETDANSEKSESVERRLDETDANSDGSKSVERRLDNTYANFSSDESKSVERRLDNTYANFSSGDESDGVERRLDNTYANFSGDESEGVDEDENGQTSGLPQ